MTAIRGLDHDGLLQGLREADGDWFDNENPPTQLRVLTSDDETSIDAAQSGIRLLVHFIEHIKSGDREGTATLEQIGTVLAGKTDLLEILFDRDAEIRRLTDALSKVHPNWFEKVSLAKRQSALLEQTRRIIVLAQEALSDDDALKNVGFFLEDALADLDDYKPAEL